MRDVTLFIAMSLDGYIAGKNSNVDWLGGQVPEDDDTVTYQEFIKGIDTVIMSHHLSPAGIGTLPRRLGVPRAYHLCGHSSPGKVYG